MWFPLQVHLGALSAVQLPDQERWVYMTVKAMVMSPPEMVGPGGYSDMFTINDFILFCNLPPDPRTQLALRARIPLTYRTGNCEII